MNFIGYTQRIRLAAVLGFYNHQPKTRADLKTADEVSNKCSKKLRPLDIG